jgi:hypothetical protein
VTGAGRLLTAIEYLLRATITSYPRAPAHIGFFDSLIALFICADPRLAGMQNRGQPARRRDTHADTTVREIDGLTCPLASEESR